MTTTAEILKKIHKDHGSNIATVGSAGYQNVLRIPTGVFSFDLASGGGVPQSKCSEIFGPESSGKTNILLRLIANAQRLWPEKMVVLVDAEHAIDKAWASKMGVDLERLILIQPESAEQAANFVESFMYADDVSMIGLDSIAMLTKQADIDKGVDGQTMGGSSLLIGKMYRHVTVAQAKMTNAGLEPPAFVAINQTRTKIGVMFGDPTTTPGGAAPRFASAMRIRVYGKNILVKKTDVMPTFKETNVTLIKWKCPILAVNAVFKMQMIEAEGHLPGYVEDWNTVSSYMKELDYLSKAEKGSGWVMNGQEYPTLAACKEALYGDPDALADMKSAIIAELIEKGQGGGSAQVEVDPETGEIMGLEE